MVLEKKISFSEESLFKIKTGVVFFFISVYCLISVLFFNLLVIKSSAAIIIKDEKAMSMYEDMVSYVISSFYDSFWIIIIILITAFVTGYYLARTIIRPFISISKYCQQKIEFKKTYQTPDFISSLDQLNSISHYFFNQIDKAYENNKLKPVIIPEHFTKIHKPKFELGFFINYFFIMIAFTLVSSYGVFYLNNSIQEKMLEILSKLLITDNTIMIVMDQLFSTMNSYLYFIISTHILIYMLFGYYLYSQVATPAFAIFATFRSFLKGNYQNRIHIVGYAFLRESCRNINKFLETAQKDLT